MDIALESKRLSISDEIPADRQFDVAYIASPTGLHIDPLVYLSTMSLPPRRIIIEKPIVSGLDEEKLLAQLSD